MATQNRPMPAVCNRLQRYVQCAVRGRGGSAESQAADDSFQLLTIQCVLQEARHKQQSDATSRCKHASSMKSKEKKKQSLELANASQHSNL